MSFSMKVLTGLIVGVILGLFLGEPAAIAAPFGSAFIALLQMTALPYIVVSLLHNLGRLDPARGKKLVAAGASVLAALLLLGVGVIALAPVAWPEREAGSFFRTSLVNIPEPIDMVGLYIPANPFASLAESVVPAVVVFCILFGVSLASLESKGPVLEFLRIFERALVKLNKIVVKATPVGVFAIAMSTAGTMTIEELVRMQAFLVSYTLICLVLGGLVLPAIVATFTPIRVRDFFRVAGGTLLTIFATSKILVVMPQLIEDAKTLIREADLGDEAEDDAEILLPLAYPFPNLGTFTIMIFVPFAAWYLGQSLSFGTTASFLAALIPSSFIAPVAGIPFLLDLVSIPRELFELFVVSTVYTDRIRVVVGGIHLLTLTLVGATILRRGLVFNPNSLARWGVVSVITIVATIGGTRLLLTQMLSDGHEGYDRFIEMSLRHGGDHIKLVDGDTFAPMERGKLTRAAEIRRRGVLRVGILDNALPFAFVNANTEPVGFDIELMSLLAAELEVELEVARFGRGDRLDVVAADRVDVFVGGIRANPVNAAELTLTDPYMHTTLGFVVPVGERSTYSSQEKLRRMSDLKFGYLSARGREIHWLEELIDGQELEQVDSPRAYLRGERPDLDALLMPAESAAAWTLIYPSYAVAVPIPRVVKLPMAFAVSPGEIGWRRYLSQWIEVQRSAGTLDSLYTHWILGQGAEEHAPRWSILQDVILAD